MDISQNWLVEASVESFSAQLKREAEETIAKPRKGIQLTLPQETEELQKLVERPILTQQEFALAKDRLIVSPRSGSIGFAGRDRR